jgi:hypothetical protein
MQETYEMVLMSLQPAVRFQLLGAVAVEKRSAIDAVTLQG